MLYPLTFTPVLRHYLWGGRNFEELFGRVLPPGSTAESWEISAHDTASTVVDAGPLSGQALPDIVAEYGTDLAGTRASQALAQGKFPLLVKLLDAQERLSVQVHPPDEYAIAHEGGDLGKTEMWYVLHAQPGAQIILGLAPGAARETFAGAIKSNRLEEWLQYVPVKAGDAIFISPGTVHAALEGLVMVEVLQNSDTTYRVYDWGRVGADGEPRALHVEKALDVINFDQPAPGPVRPRQLTSSEGITRYELSRCEYFVVEKVSLNEGTTYQGRTDGETFEIWGTVNGESDLGWGEEIFSLKAIRFCLIPACLGDFFIRARKPSTMLRIYLP